MPGGDGTGPLGLGPMTGRAAGYCAGYPMPGYANPMAGRGFGGRGMGLGRGRGRGWRWWARARMGPVFPAPVPGWPQATPQDEADALRRQAEALQGQLNAVRKRLEELATANVKK